MTVLEEANSLKAELEEKIMLEESEFRLDALKGALGKLNVCLNIIEKEADNSQHLKHLLPEILEKAKRIIEQGE